MPQPKPRTDSGHGHVFPRLDGFVARCGGPSICPECAKDFAQITSLKDQMTAPPKYQSIPTPPARPMSDLPDSPQPFALSMRACPDGHWVIGTYGNSFGVFDSTAALVEYLRATADRVEREGADYGKERANRAAEEEK